MTKYRSKLFHIFKCRLIGVDDDVVSKQMGSLRNGPVVFPAVLAFVEDTEYKHFQLGITAEWKAAAVCKDVSPKCKLVYISYRNPSDERAPFVRIGR